MINKSDPSRISRVLAEIGCVNLSKTLFSLRLSKGIFRGLPRSVQRYWAQRMLRMGIGGMMVRMIRFTMFMAMNMAVFMAVSLKRNTIRLADSRAFPFAECAAFSESLHVMVVALLGSSNILFKAQNLGSVLAERAIHCRVSSEHFVHPLSKCVHHHRVLT